MSPPASAIDESDVTAYARDGVVCLRGAFDVEWIELLREAVAKDKARPGPMVRHNTPEGGRASSSSISSSGGAGPSADVSSRRARRRQ